MELVGGVWLCRNTVARCHLTSYRARLALLSGHLSLHFHGTFPYGSVNSFPYRYHAARLKPMKVSSTLITTWRESINEEAWLM